MGLVCFAIDGKFDCKLQDVLIFFTGASCVPPVGFEKQPKVVFLSNQAVLSTSSTCDLILRLPIKYKEYNDFRDAMLMALIDNDGFGGV